MNIVDFLQNNKVGNKRTAQFKHARFSEEAGEDVIVTLRALDFDQLEEINTLHETDGDVYVVLEGMVEPNLKNDELRKKYKAAGYDELVKEIFLPGEIKRIATHVMALSGFRADSVTKLEKNLPSAQE